MNTNQVYAILTIITDCNLSYFAKIVKVPVTIVNIIYKGKGIQSTVV